MSDPEAIQDGKGRFAQRLTPRQREIIRTDYLDKPSPEVGLMFGVTGAYVRYLRSGERGLRTRGLGDPRKMRSANETELAVKFLTQALPLLRNTCEALVELKTTGVFHTSIDPPPQDRRPARDREDKPAARRKGPAGPPPRAADGGAGRQGDGVHAAAAPVVDAGERAADPAGPAQRIGDGTAGLLFDRRR